MIDDTANLSIDFLVGFTIFIVAFIYVATLIPGLMLGLQSNTIDYNAVAYRTGVILVEDPGSPVSWENNGIYSDNYIQTNGIRFGLALSKDTPNILSQQKLNRFFCSTFVYPEDYRSRAVFGNYPYLFNISLQIAGNTITQSIGDVLPDGYGYVRRVVQLKGWSNATIGSSTIQALNYDNKTNVTTHSFFIQINSTDLLNNATNPCMHKSHIPNQSVGGSVYDQPHRSGYPIPSRRIQCQCQSVRDHHPQGTTITAVPESFAFGCQGFLHWRSSFRGSVLLFIYRWQFHTRIPRFP